MGSAVATTLALDVYPGGEPWTHHVCKMNPSQYQCIVFEAPMPMSCVLVQVTVRAL